MKLLKQFDPDPNWQFDDEGLKAKMRRGRVAGYTIVVGDTVPWLQLEK